MMGVSGQSNWLSQKALFLVILIISDAFVAPVFGQLSDPIAHDDNLANKAQNKFLQREASKDGSEPASQDEEPSPGNTQCPKNTELRWMSEVSASIYSTPLVADINSDGRAEVIVPSFIHYLDVLEGTDGEKLPGWPAFHKSSVHSSPFLYDVDKDGVREIGLATYNGEILFFRPTGELLPGKLVVPRLKVRKDWYVGLDPDPVDHSKPDVGDQDPVDNPPSKPDEGKETELIRTGEHAVKPQEGGESSGGAEEVLVAGGVIQGGENGGGDEKVVAAGEGTVSEGGVVSEKEAVEGKSTEEGKGGVGGEGVSDDQSGGVVEAGEKTPGDEANTGDGDEIETGLSNELGEVGAAVDARLLRWEEANTGDGQKSTADEKDGAERGELIEGAVEKEATGTQRRRLLWSTDEEEIANGGVRRRLLAEGVDSGATRGGVATAEMEGKLDPEAAESFEIFDKDSGEGGEGDPEWDKYDLDDFDFDHAEEMWADEEWRESNREMEKDFVFIDAHILCSPVVADIDSDGRDELIVAASYFFDLEYYEDPAHAKELPEGIDLHKYIAGGIVAFDLFDMRVKWNVHLDLSTDATEYRAYIYSHPTVVDLDRDGYMEILVGTSEGFLYCLSHVGYPRENFPIQMGEIQGQVIAADINNDGYLEIVAVDTRGNVAAFDWRGRELWERHVASMISQGVSVGDVNGDGQPEVTFGTTSGHVYALSGENGHDVSNFPFRTHGRVMAPILLTNLKPSRPRAGGLDLVVTSFDGFVYMIEGETGCADVIDVGETAYSMVLAESVHGGPEMDLLVATMNGNVYCFQTGVSYHPSKAWPAQNHHRNTAFPRQSKGVFALPSSRQLRDVGGESFPVQFEVLDLGPMGTNYTVTISLMAPGHKTHKLRQTYSMPGVYTVRIPVPKVRTHAHVLLEMEDEHKLYYSDEFAVLFNMYFYRILKWVLVLPLLGTTIAMLAMKQGGQERGAPLPTSLNSHRL